LFEPMVRRVFSKVQRSVYTRKQTA
jgi:hypothetical protein